MEAMTMGILLDRYLHLDYNLPSNQSTTILAPMSDLLNISNLPAGVVNGATSHFIVCNEKRWNSASIDCDGGVHLILLAYSCAKQKW